MNDNLRRYCAMQKALKSLRPTEPKGNVARHLNTLAMLIAGIVGSRKCHLPAVAQMPSARGGTKSPVGQQATKPCPQNGTLADEQSD